MNTVRNNWSRRVAILLAFVMLFGLIAFLPVFADDTKIANLMPSKKSSVGKLTLNGCTMEENADGSVTFTLTATNATFKMVFAENFYEEGKGGTIHSETNVDLSKPALVAFDYGSADGVTLGMIAHYTRKDKAADKKLADLYLSSMLDDNYKDYRKQSGDGFGIWDWGAYVTKDAAKTFDNKTHRFTDVEGTLAGAVGKKITLYSFFVTSATKIDTLGAKRPTPTPVESSSSTSTSTSTSTSSVETSTTTTTSSAVTTSSVSSTSTSGSPSSSSSASTNSSVNTSSKSADESSNTLTYILIAVAVLAVAGGAAYFIIKKKK